MPKAYCALLVRLSSTMRIRAGVLTLGSSGVVSRGGAPGSWPAARTGHTAWAGSPRRPRRMPYVVATQRVGDDHDDRDVAERGVRLDPARGFVPVDTGELDVHEDEAGATDRKSTRLNSSHSQ